MKVFLKKHNVVYEPDTLIKSLWRLRKKQIIYDAGRGYYSTVENTVDLDTSPVKDIKDLISLKYPFLPFSLWSTEQIVFSFHHVPTRYATLIYTDKDALSSLTDFLNSNGYKAYDNPYSKEVEKYFDIEANPIVIRPSVGWKLKKQVFAPIEVILVDLYIESQLLYLADLAEYQRIMRNILSHYRVNISALLDYAERRKVQNPIQKFINMSINPTLTRNVG